MNSMNHVRMYMASLERFIKKGPTDVRIDPLSFHTLGILHNRINHMWCNSSGSTPVQCMAINSVVPVEITAEHGLVFITPSSMFVLSSITEELREYRHSGVKWVYVPLALHWKGPRNSSDDDDQTVRYHLCMLVVDNRTMEYDFFDPKTEDVHILDTSQIDHDLIIQVHNILRCIHSQSLLVDYKPTHIHRKLEHGVQTPMQCAALVFFTVACCRRYQFGNPWGVAESIVHCSYTEPVRNTDPLFNWLHWLYKCMSWTEVAMCVGLLLKGSPNQTRCGVIVDENLQPCVERGCRPSHKYQHAYCNKHRFELILCTWFRNPTFDIWRYVSSDVWSVKTDPLPIGTNDGEVIDVDGAVATADCPEGMLVPFRSKKRNRTSTDTQQQTE